MVVGADGRGRGGQGDDGSRDGHEHGDGQGDVPGPTRSPPTRAHRPECSVRFVGDRRPTLCLPEGRRAAVPDPRSARMTPEPMDPDRRAALVAQLPRRPRRGRRRPRRHERRGARRAAGGRGRVDAARGRPPPRRQRDDVGDPAPPPDRGGPARRSWATTRPSGPAGCTTTTARSGRRSTRSRRPARPPSDLLDRLTEAEWARAGTHTESGAYGVERWLEIYAAHAARPRRPDPPGTRVLRRLAIGITRRRLTPSQHRPQNPRHS